MTAFTTFVAGTKAESALVNANLTRLPPIGVIMSWLKSFINTPALPDGWVECNGQVLSDANSPFNGLTLPNLNGNANILYGAATSGNIKSEDYVPNHLHNYGTLKGKTESGSSSAAYYGGTGTYGQSIHGDTGNTESGTALAGYSVVFIMRVS